MNICFIFNERTVLNRLRLVRTSNRSRPVLISFLQSLISPVWFFEVLGLWWTSLSLGLSPWRSKTKTGPDFQSLSVNESFKGKIKKDRKNFREEATRCNIKLYIAWLHWKSELYQRERGQRPKIRI